jgi:hypothetical protein
MTTTETKREKAEAAVQRAETEMANAYESGNAERIQKAETRMSNAMERMERING